MEETGAKQETTKLGSGWDQDGNCKGCNKWLDSEYILQIGMTGFAKELGVGCDNKEGVMGDSKVWLEQVIGWNC